MEGDRSKITMYYDRFCDRQGEGVMGVHGRVI